MVLQTIMSSGILKHSYPGCSFNCSDPLLNNIWMMGAYTVQLNMQDYLWDGVKRDRLVWVGDLTTTPDGSVKSEIRKPGH